MATAAIFQSCGPADRREFLSHSRKCRVYSTFGYNGRAVMINIDSGMEIWNTGRSVYAKKEMVILLSLCRNRKIFLHDDPSVSRREFRFRIAVILRHILLRSYVQILDELAPIYPPSAVRLFLGCPPKCRLQITNSSDLPPHNFLSYKSSKFFSLKSKRLTNIRDSKKRTSKNFLEKHLKKII